MSDDGRHTRIPTLAKDEKDIPRFGEIFRIAFRVLVEKPKTLAAFAIFLSLMNLGMDALSNKLLEPYLPAANILFSQETGLPETPGEGTADGTTDTREIGRNDGAPNGPADAATNGPVDDGANAQASVADFRATIERLAAEHGAGRLFLAFFLPLLLSPLVTFTVTTGALAMWDGQSLRPGDFARSLAGYFPALRVTLLAAVLWLLLVWISFLFAVPAVLVAGSRGGAANSMALLIVIVLTAIIWFRYVWPYARGLFLLPFFVFFRLADHPGLADTFASSMRFFAKQKEFHREANEMTVWFFLILIGLAVPLEFSLMVLNGGLPRFALELFANAVMTAGMLWPIIAMAGFHRLRLSNGN
ncbi:MAG: hypothetical protein LBF41_08285 [Deltaproteobacteria bacterium]|jgi:hypothetical protein|nr:hypothetical protein [Deltaproteobacteria bacterium]